MKTIRVTAPGRICLFGDHQDYLHLPIIACTIDRYIHLTAKPINEKYFLINLTDLEKTFQIPLNPKEQSEDHEGFYISALKVLQSEGINITQGYQLQIHGNLPINSGLSSSTAVLITWIQFLIKASHRKQKTTPEQIADWAYKAEVESLGLSGGKMDQYSISIGQTLYLETGEKPNFKQFRNPIGNLVIGESGVAKKTEHLLKDKKEKAIQAIEEVKKHHASFVLEKATCDDLPTYLPLLSKELQPYLEAAIGNHVITQKALQEFEITKPNTKILANLMNAHHQILKNKLKITVPKIDLMIENTLKQGALGAKIVGSGMGGCIVAICPPNNTQKVIQSLLDVGAKSAFQVQITDGVQINNGHD